MRDWRDKLRARRWARHTLGSWMNAWRRSTMMSITNWGWLTNKNRSIGIKCKLSWENTIGWKKTMIFWRNSGASIAKKTRGLSKIWPTNYKSQRNSSINWRTSHKKKSNSLSLKSAINKRDRLHTKRSWRHFSRKTKSCSILSSN